eukprot:CAMPEP_0170198848 /NCGR_PEP_ID=MMETSP0040_2-20121228/69013_1 /TAXON_ID=641309 /ORGANISM="Lotharella oceanica, Strain CCMP622" /LENGTH=110 /DNA_ID=CAMNT_0010448907 /DNA_START=505 /DNA_END=837 /DNA_ORIENTATION=+
MGGPLTLGDIEEISGDPCVKCPWHSYLVSLTCGKKYSQTVEFDSRGKPKRVNAWSTGKTQQQRVHHVAVDANGGVIVTLSKDSAAMKSDKYATDAEASRCFEKALGNSKR